MSEKTSTASSQKETTYDAIKRKWEAVYTSIHPSYVSSENGNRGTGGGGARAPFQYFKNYKELVRKGALYPPPNIESLMVTPLPPLPPPPPPPPPPPLSAVPG